MKTRDRRSELERQLDLEQGPPTEAELVKQLEACLERKPMLADTYHAARRLIARWRAFQ